jgi:hypothetical protein
VPRNNRLADVADSVIRHPAAEHGPSASLTADDSKRYALSGWQAYDASPRLRSRFLDGCTATFDLDRSDSAVNRHFDLLLDFGLKLHGYVRFVPGETLQLNLTSTQHSFDASL